MAKASISWFDDPNRFRNLANSTREVGGAEVDV
jgi:hypothetical protein